MPQRRPLIDRQRAYRFILRAGGALTLFSIGLSCVYNWFFFLFLGFGTRSVALLPDIGADAFAAFFSIAITVPVIIFPLVNKYSALRFEGAFDEEAAPLNMRDFFDQLFSRQAEGQRLNDAITLVPSALLISLLLVWLFVSENSDLLAVASLLMSLILAIWINYKRTPLVAGSSFL